MKRLPSGIGSEPALPWIDSQTKNATSEIQSALLRRSTLAHLASLKTIERLTGSKTAASRDSTNLSTPARILSAKIDRMLTSASERLDQ